MTILVSPQTYVSWQALLEAVRIRSHDSIMEVAKHQVDKEVPKIYYHRKCRSVFTMKRDLETIVKKRSSESLGDGAACSSKRLCRRSSESRVYDAVCIFCNKVKFQKGSKSREKLTQTFQLRADKTLRECAIQKNDGKILAVASRDIVAAEAHYHHSCYKNYTRMKPRPEDVKEGDNEFEEAYGSLFEYIRTDIIPNEKIVQVTSLTAKLKSFVPSGEISESTRKNIRRRLESEFENSVHIFPDDKGWLLMVPVSVTLQDVVLENQSLQKELEIWKSKVTNLKQIDQVSTKLRYVIKEDIKPTTWPYHPSDVNSTCIPHYLERFLTGLLTGDPDVKSRSHRVSTLVQSFSQDMIYAVSHGQHKPPKHLLFPYAVKTLTGNIEIIRLLNKFGHGVSYSQLEENDTALCLQKLATSLNHRVALPASIKPYVFTNLSWDKILIDWRRLLLVKALHIGSMV